MTRPRLALLQRVAKDFAQDVAKAARRRRASPEGQPPNGASADELARRLDETRERLRREISPPDSEYP